MWWLHATRPSDKRFYCSLHHVLTEVNIIPTPPPRRSARPSRRMRPRSTTSSASCLAPVQAGGGGQPQGEARRRYQSP